MVKNTTVMRASLIAAIVLCGIVLFWSDIGAAVCGVFAKTSDDVPVLMADHFIPPFQVVRPGDVRVKYMPREFVPPGALHAAGDLLKEDGQVLYSSIVGIPEGQALTRTLVNETGKDHGMSSLLRPGRVAVSFKVDREKSAGGWVQPGDTIAVFASANDVGRHGEFHETRLLLNAVEVLAVDRAHLGHEPDDDNQPKNPLDVSLQDANDQIVTVLVNTADAATLVEAQRAGSLTIVLRPLGDDLPWIQSDHGGRP